MIAFFTVLILLVLLYFIFRRRNRSPLQRLLMKALSLARQGNDTEAIDVINQIINQDPEVKEPRTIIQAMMLKVDCLGRLAGIEEPIMPSYLSLVSSDYLGDLGPLGVSKEAVNACDTLIQTFKNHDDTDIKQVVITTMLCKGMHLRVMEDSIKIISNNDDMINYGNDDKDAYVISSVLNAMLNKGTELEAIEKLDDAIKAYEVLEKKFEDLDDNQLENIKTFIEAMTNKNKLLNRLGHTEKALTNLESLFKRYEHEHQKEMLPALVAYANALAVGKRYKDSLTYYNKCIDSFASLNKSDEYEKMGRAYIGKAIILEQMGQYHEACKVYDTLINDFADIDEFYIDYDLLPLAYITKAIILDNMNEADESNKMLATLMGSSDITLRETGSQVVLGGYETRANLLREMGLISQAITTYNFACNRIYNDKQNSGYDEYCIPTLLLNRHKMMLSAEYEKCTQLNHELVIFGDSVVKDIMDQAIITENRNTDDAFAYYELTIILFDQRSEPEIKIQMISVLINKLMLLIEFERDEDTQAVIEELDARLQSKNHNIALAKSLIERANKSTLFDLPQKAILAASELLRRFEDTQEPTFFEFIAEALCTRGMMYKLVDKFDDALSDFNLVEERFANTDNQTILASVAQSIYEKAMLLSNDQPEKKFAIFDDFISRFNDSKEPLIELQYAKTLQAKGELLIYLQRDDEAMPLFEEVIKHFSNRDECGLIEQVTDTKLKKIDILLIKNEFATAMETYNQIEPDHDILLNDESLISLVTISFKLGEYLDMADRKEEAITCYTKLIERYDDNYLEDIIDIVFSAYLAKAINLITLKQTNQAREVFQSILIEFGEEERFKKEISEVKGYINKL